MLLLLITGGAPDALAAEPVEPVAVSEPVATKASPEYFVPRLTAEYF